MKHHTKVYMSYFNYDISDFIPCEIPSCGKRAVDINHINARGMGGSKQKDDVSNLMAMCREHHIFYGDKVEYKEFLQNIHNKTMER